MKKLAANALGIGIVAGLISLAFYFFAFGQTFEGNITISPSNGNSSVIGIVEFQARFQNRRFLTHSVFLDLAPDTHCTYQGKEIEASKVVQKFDNMQIMARVGYREDDPGWGRVISLDLEPQSSSPKEYLLVISVILIFVCTGGMAVLAKME